MIGPVNMDQQINKILDQHADDCYNLRSLSSEVKPMETIVAVATAVQLHEHINFQHYDMNLNTWSWMITFTYLNLNSHPMKMSLTVSTPATGRDSIEHFVFWTPNSIGSLLENLSWLWPWASTIRTNFEMGSRHQTKVTWTVRSGHDFQNQCNSAPGIWII